jgi:cell division protein FtsZ
MGVRGVTDLMVAPGLVNLDFADIRTVMAEMGKAMMGTGEAEGDNRAIRAAESAISNPLLEDTCMSGARGLLINITGGDDMTLFEVDQAANRIREEVDEDANIIFGSAIDESLAGKVRVSVVATGIETPGMKTERPRLVAVGGTAMGAQPVAKEANVTVAAAPVVGAPAPFVTPAMQPPLLRGATAAAVARAPVAPVPSPRPTMLHPAPERAAPAPAAPAPDVPPGSATNTAPPSAAARPIVIEENPVHVPHGVPEHLRHPVKPAGVSPPQRRSIFSIVTGVVRGAQAAVAPAAPAPTPSARVEPSLHEGHDVPRANVRPASGEDLLDIPAFLRRQTS